MQLRLSELTRARAVSAAPAGRAFTRFAMCLMAAKGDPLRAVAIAEQRKGIPDLGLMVKAAVDVGTTTDSTWAAPLANLETAAEEFVALLRPQTILGRMVGVRKVPFQIRFPKQTAGASVGWIGSGKPKLVSELAFEGETFTHAQIGGIVIFSDSLMQFSNPAAEGLVQNDLIAAISMFSDQQLLDPNVAEVADTSPAAITWNAPSYVSSGSNAAQVEADIKLLISSLANAGILFTSPYFIMRPSTALHLGTLMGTGGERIFPDVNVKGGNILGIPVIVSAAVPTDGDSPSANLLILLDAAEMLLAEGGIEIDASQTASVQLDSDPQSGAQTLVSLWAGNLVGCRVERLIRWQMRRDNAVAVLTGVAY